MWDTCRSVWPGPSRPAMSSAGWGCCPAWLSQQTDSPPNAAPLVPDSTGPSSFCSPPSPAAVRLTPETGSVSAAMWSTRTQSNAVNDSVSLIYQNQHACFRHLIFSIKSFKLYFLHSLRIIPIQLALEIYSGYGKYSDPLTFFTLCYIAAIC